MSGNKPSAIRSWLVIALVARAIENGRTLERLLVESGRDLVLKLRAKADAE